MAKKKNSTGISKMQLEFQLPIERAMMYGALKNHIFTCLSVGAPFLGPVQELYDISKGLDYPIRFCSRWAERFPNSGEIGWLVPAKEQIDLLIAEVTNARMPMSRAREKARQVIHSLPSVRLHALATLLKHDCRSGDSQEPICRT